MLNTIMIIGRLKEIDRENKILTINYNVDKDNQQTFCLTSNDKILEELSKYCKENDTIAIKGHLGIMYDEQVVVIDKVSFLSSNSNN